jgi:hypothetical protein
MRKSQKILGAVAVAGLIAAGSAAFTATSTIDDAAVHVGAVTQSITGVTVTNVDYTINPATDLTTVVTFDVDEDLVATDKVTATISATAPADTETVVCAAGVPSGGTTLTCTFAGVVNVNRLDIVAS